MPRLSRKFFLATSKKVCIACLSASASPGVLHSSRAVQSHTRLRHTLRRRRCQARICGPAVINALFTAGVTVFGEIGQRVVKNRSALAFPHLTSAQSLQRARQLSCGSHVAVLIAEARRRNRRQARRRRPSGRGTTRRTIGTASSRIRPSKMQRRSGGSPHACASMPSRRPACHEYTRMRNAAEVPSRVPRKPHHGLALLDAL